MVSPRRSAAIQLASGTRTPDVVPFQVKTMSVAQSTCERSGSSPYSALTSVTSLSLSCLTTSVIQPSPKDSHASIVTGRAPSSDHSAISTAPVSDAGTMPTRCSDGMFRISRVRSMARLSLARPGFDRCDRAISASVRAWRFQPGRLAHGPEEKCGTSGRTPGLDVVMIYPSRWAPLVGEGCPARGNKGEPPFRQAQADDGGRTTQYG